MGVEVGVGVGVEEAWFWAHTRTAAPRSSRREATGH